MPHQDEMLIKRSQKGDIDAFEQLIAGYQQKIFNIAYRYIGNYHDAADISQEIILKIYRSLPRFRGDASFSTWVYRISINACHDYAAKCRDQRQKSLDSFVQTLDGDLSLEIADLSSMPENNYISKEKCAYLQKLIIGLPEEYRVIIILREIEGLSYTEIEDCLKLPLGTVKSRINRAREALRKKIVQSAEQYPEFSRLIIQKEAKIANG